MWSKHLDLQEKIPKIFQWGWGEEKRAPQRSSLEGHQGEEPVDAKLLRGEHEAPHGAWRSEQEGAECASEGRPLRLRSNGTGEPEKVSEHQQDQTGLGRGTSGVPPRQGVRNAGWWAQRRQTWR